MWNGARASRGWFRHFTQRFARESVVGPLSPAETWDLQPLSALALLSFPRLGGFTILGQLQCGMCCGQYYSGAKTEDMFSWWKGNKMQARCLNFPLPTLLWKFLTWECCDAVSNLVLLSPWLKGFTASQGAFSLSCIFVNDMASWIFYVLGVPCMRAGDRWLKEKRAYISLTPPSFRCNCSWF